MPRRTKRDEAREQEILNSHVDPTGQGEDRVVREALSSDFLHMDSVAATKLMVEFQKLIMGQSSLIESQNEKLNRILERQEEFERKQQEFEANKQKWLEEVSERANRHRIADPDDLEHWRAKQAEKATAVMAQARVEEVQQRVLFERKLADEPKVPVMWPGEAETVIQNGSMTMRMRGKVVSIKHLRWQYEPGKIVEVPETVAKRLEQINRQEQHLEQRKNILSLDNGFTQENEQLKVAQKWAEADRNSGSPSGAFPLH